MIEYTGTKFSLRTFISNYSSATLSLLCLFPLSDFQLLHSFLNILFNSRYNFRLLYTCCVADAIKSIYISSQLSPASLPANMFGPLEFSVTDSPISPLSTRSDWDTLATLSDAKEHLSSTYSLSVRSPSCILPRGTNSCYHNRLDFSPSSDSPQDPVVGSSDENIFSQNSGSVVSMKHALKELETALMGDETTSPEPQVDESQSLPTSGIRSKDEELSNMSSGNLKWLLIECATAISENRVDDFEKLVQHARKEVSVSGKPIERLGAYMVEGLVARKQSSGTNIYHTLRCKEPHGRDLLTYMHILYEICPYLKFGYMAANGAISDACRNEDHIHIIDFQIAQGTQWFTLLQALAKGPGKVPCVRITGIDDPISMHARGGTLEAVGDRLKVLSEKYKIPVEFHAVPVAGPDVTREMLDVRPGEALVVNFPLQLHHIPDECVDVNNPRDNLLRMVKSLNPKVMTLIEQESNTNTTPFVTRFIEALEYYSAMFESIDVIMARDRKERINVEQHCLARDIVNVIACEGKERVERHELFGKWKLRLTMAGFRQFPLSPYVNSVIRSLLRCYSEHYTLMETEDGAILLGWKERMLISASAWH